MMCILCSFVLCCLSYDQFYHLLLLTVLLNFIIIVLLHFSCSEDLSSTWSPGDGADQGIPTTTNPRWS